MMNYATYIIDIVALCYLSGLLHSGTMLNISRKKPFLYGIALTIIIIIAEAGTILAGNDFFGVRGPNILCNVVGFALTSLIPILLSTIFDVETLKANKWLLLPTLVNILAAVLSPLFKFIFYVDAGNAYFRGSYFFIFVAVYIFNTLFLVASTLHIARKHHYPIMRKMVALTLFTVAGTTIQLINPSLHLSWHCVTLSLFLYFILMSDFDGSFDPLTGLYNRATFDKAAKQLIGQNAFSIIVLDINDFKSVNDSYGHEYGDTVLKTVAAIIRETFDKHFTCYRIGGDEFAVIGFVTDRDSIERQLGSMINTFAQKRASDNRLPTVAFGYSVCPGGKEQEFQTYFNRADEQMYHYKKRHKALAAVTLES